MKAPPKRKGYHADSVQAAATLIASMKALPKRKGNAWGLVAKPGGFGLNESPSQKEGRTGGFFHAAPKFNCLNESPSKKEGKSRELVRNTITKKASMKALPKRKGNELKGIRHRVGAVMPQ